MVALQIRDVPDDIRATLAGRAAARGQSLQAYLLTLVTREAQRAANLARLETFAGRNDGSRFTSAEHAQTLTDARTERDDRSPGPRAAS